MRSQSRWGLLVLVALTLFALARLWKLGSVEGAGAPDTSASEAEQSPTEPEVLLQPIPDPGVRETLPEADAAPSSEDEVVADSGGATLVVTLIGGGRPVGPGVLQIDRSDRGESETRNVESVTGQALFGGLSTGRHQIRLFQLPTGWLPPRAALSYYSSDGVRNVPVEIHPGANTCGIVLERPVRVFGQVLGPNGEHLDKTHVVFTAFDSAGARTREPPVEFSVARGWYEGELYEGIWSGEVRGFAESKTSPEGDAPLADCSPPLPQVRMLHSGSSFQLDFACERLSGMIEGHVFDECGRPFRGLRLLASRFTPSKEPEFGSTFFIHQRVALAVSAEDGSFAFRNLVPGPYRVSVEYGEFLAVTRPGINVVGEPVEPVDVQLGANNLANVEMTARRSHPVRVRGSIETRIDLPAPSLFLRMAASPGRVTRWNVDGSGWRFDFYVEASVSDLILEVESDGQKATYPLALSLDTEQTPLVLRFPK